MRLQLNLLVERNAGIPYIMASLPPRGLLFPVMWFESDAELSESIAGPLLLLLNLPVIMKACGLAGLVLGLQGMLSMLACLLRLRQEEEEPAPGKPELVTAVAFSRRTDCEYSQVPLSCPTITCESTAKL